MENFDLVKYYSTLKLIFMKSAYDLDNKIQIKVLHSLNKGVFIEISRENGDLLLEEDINIIKEKMKKIIDSDIEIHKNKYKIEDIYKISSLEKREDLFKLVETNQLKSIILYHIDDYYDYFNDDLYSSTRYVKEFEIKKYNGGVILKFPRDEKMEIPEDIKFEKLSKIFYENEKLGEILNVSNVGDLNIIAENKIRIEELIRINEALHIKKISDIINNIIEQNKKLITIAGPSSSGKTTFTKKLEIFLKANGYKPVVISLDNYYLNRDIIPLDENGEKDYEAIEALDLDLIGIQINDIINGKKVEIPDFNFISGKREYNGEFIQLEERGILLIEGIHGLNDRLTNTIPKDVKYKIYISCLTQLNIDFHNRIPTSNVRKIRRLVRDSLSRGTTAEKTLDMWDSVRRGEEKHIFVFQEEADIMYNSNLFYELSVLKPYALKELALIEEDSKHYAEARKLIKFLSYFKEIDDRLVPDDSILKEFIGESYFYKY